MANSSINVRDKEAASLEGMQPISVRLSLENELGATEPVSTHPTSAAGHQTPRKSVHFLFDPDHVSPLPAAAADHHLNPLSPTHPPVHQNSDADVRRPSSPISPGSVSLDSPSLTALPPQQRPLRSILKTYNSFGSINLETDMTHEKSSRRTSKNTIANSRAGSLSVAGSDYIIVNVPEETETGNGEDQPAVARRSQTAAGPRASSSKSVTIDDISVQEYER
jgi:hypothetical protein